MTFIKKMAPGRFIVLGFVIAIFLGAILLMFPFSVNEGVNLGPMDALFTSASAVCITGLISVDIKDTFTVFGRIVVALLIQIGGLGVTSVGVGFILLARKKVNFKERLLIKESLNLTSVKGGVKLVKSILLMTLCFEAIGTVLSFIVFSQDFPPLEAFGISIFHSISAFNNSGFDVFGGMMNLIPYRDNVLLNLTTCGLIIVGGLGFLVIKEMLHKHSFKRFTLHTKIVLFMTVLLLFLGTILLKFTEHMTWLSAFFYSTSARTSGFSTHFLEDFSNAGFFILVILMFIGTAPGSMGGGIKVTTFFVLVKSAYSIAVNKHCMAFKRKIPGEIISKAFIIALLSLTVVCFNTLLLCILEPEYSFIQILFEITSAFSTVGFSTGITPDLSAVSKLVLIVTMFIGRLGPLTMATIWTIKPLPNIRYSEESITIG